MRIKVVNDEKLVNEVRKKIIENDGYCICHSKKTEETKCMCCDFLSKKELGVCKCGLYEKVEL